MTASDFIEEVRVGLQEKSTHWKDRELFVLLQRAYGLLQFDLPYFFYKESIEAKRGDESAYLEFEALKNISLKVDEKSLTYANIEHLYKDEYKYSLENDKIIFWAPMKKDCVIRVVYKYKRELKNLGCALDLPCAFVEALRLLFLSFIYEKPTLNTKQRNLSAYYKKEYAFVTRNIPKTIRTVPKNIKSIYQRI